MAYSIGRRLFSRMQLPHSRVSCRSNASATVPAEVTEGEGARDHIRSYDPQGRCPRGLWRLDPLNPYTVVPQAWVTSFDNLEPKNIDLIDLHPSVFRHPPRMDLLAQNIRWQSTYKTVCFVKAQTRAEMPGQDKKPHPQKGTGRARAGSVYAPHWHGGGVSHGIRGPKTNFYMLPDSIRLSGLSICLTLKHIQDDLVIVDTFDNLPWDAPRKLQLLAEKRNWGYSVLFVDTEDLAARNLALAAAEIDGFDILPVYGLNCASMLKYDTLVVTRRAIERVEERILHNLHRAGTLNNKFRYMDWKDTILKEAETEENPRVPPFV